MYNFLFGTTSSGDNKGDNYDGEANYDNDGIQDTQMGCV